MLLLIILQIEDARAAMFIYNKHKKAWEKSMKRGKKKPAEPNVNDPNVPTVLL
jgi:RNA exonuclease 4